MFANMVAATTGLVDVNAYAVSLQKNQVTGKHEIALASTIRQFTWTRDRKLGSGGFAEVYRVRFGNSGAVLAEKRQTISKTRYVGETAITEPGFLKNVYNDRFDNCVAREMVALLSLSLSTDATNVTFCDAMRPILWYADASNQVYCSMFTQVADMDLGKFIEIHGVAMAAPAPPPPANTPSRMDKIAKMLGLKRSATTTGPIPQVAVSGRPEYIRLTFEIMGGIMNGLAAVHEAGWIHRDIKPANVLMYGNTPKIADFGLAVEIPERGDDPLLEIAGSHGYLAPEILRGSRYYREKVDVWSAGCVLLCMLSCQPSLMTDAFMGWIADQDEFDAYLDTQGQNRNDSLLKYEYEQEFGTDYFHPKKGQARKIIEKCLPTKPMDVDRITRNILVRNPTIRMSAKTMCNVMRDIEMNLSVAISQVV